MNSAKRFATLATSILAIAASDIARAQTQSEASAAAQTIVTDETLKGIAAINFYYKDGNQKMCGVADDKGMQYFAQNGRFTTYSFDPSVDMFRYVQGHFDPNKNQVADYSYLTDGQHAALKAGRKHNALKDDEPVQNITGAFRQERQTCLTLIGQIKKEFAGHQVAVQVSRPLRTVKAGDIVAMAIIPKAAP